MNNSVCLVSYKKKKKVDTFSEDIQILHLDAEITVEAENICIQDLDCL